MYKGGIEPETIKLPDGTEEKRVVCPSCKKSLIVFAENKQLVDTNYIMQWLTTHDCCQACGE